MRRKRQDGDGGQRQRKAAHGRRLRRCRPAAIPGRGFIATISEVPASSGANAERAWTHVGSGSSVVNTPPEVGSGLSPTPARGGFHEGTPPRAGCAAAVEDAAPL